MTETEFTHTAEISNSLIF